MAQYARLLEASFAKRSKEYEEAREEAARKEQAKREAHGGRVVLSLIASEKSIFIERNFATQDTRELEMLEADALAKMIGMVLADYLNASTSA